MRGVPSSTRCPQDAARSEDAAVEAFGRVGPVIDVQTHFLAPHSAAALGRAFLFDMYQSLMPDWWTEMDDLEMWTFAEYVRNVFVESETVVAVLTSGPGLLASRNLFNDELSAARMLFDGAGGSGRILNHAVVHADAADEVGRMAEWRDQLRPVGWKVYTLGRATRQGRTQGWMLDDEAHGLPFLERAREVDVKLVCAHKGISRLVDNGSPRDVGPAAKAFPDLDFVIYHSGYELPIDGAPPEGPYRADDTSDGVDRLLASLDQADVPAGGERLRGARVHVVLPRQSADRGCARPRQADQAARTRQRDLGDRQHLVRFAAAADRCVPDVPDPRRHVRGVRLRAADRRGAPQDPGRERGPRLRPRSRRGGRR